MSDNPAPSTEPTLFDLPGDDAALDDLAAELDDPAEPEPDTAPAPDPDAVLAYEGVCRGGPYDGRAMSSRFPKGFLLVDKPTSRMWLYDYTAGDFVCRSSVAVDRLATADGIEYDIIAYDAEGPTP